MARPDLRPPSPPAARPPGGGQTSRKRDRASQNLNQDAAACDDTTKPDPHKSHL
jgi:hypothetical protein